MSKGSGNNAELSQQLNIQFSLNRFIFKGLNKESKIKKISKTLELFLKGLWVLNIPEANSFEIISPIRKRHKGNVNPWFHLCHPLLGFILILNNYYIRGWCWLRPSRGPITTESPHKSLVWSTTREIGACEVPSRGWSWACTSNIRVWNPFWNGVKVRIWPLSFLVGTRPCARFALLVGTWKLQCHIL